MKRILFPLLMLTMSTACGSSKKLPDPTELMKQDDQTSVVQTQTDDTADATTSSITAGQKWNITLGSTDTELIARSSDTVEALLADNRAVLLTIDPNQSTDTLKVFTTEYKGVLTDHTNASYPSESKVELKIDLASKKSDLSVKDYIQRFGSSSLTEYNSISGTASF